MSESRYKHDCDECKFICEYEGGDLYARPQDGRPTWVWRYGNEGRESIDGNDLGFVDWCIKGIKYGRE